MSDVQEEKMHFLKALFPEIRYIIVPRVLIYFFYYARKLIVSKMAIMTQEFDKRLLNVYLYTCNGIL